LECTAVSNPLKILKALGNLTQLSEFN